MNNLISAIFIMGFISCSSSYKGNRHGEDYTKKRSAANARVNTPPNFEKIQFPVASANRAPASAIEVDPTLRSLSNKRIYFLTLLNQYQNFASYLDQNVPAIRSCSHFHSTHLEHQKVGHSKKQGNPWKNSVLLRSPSVETQGLFPELFLALDHKDSRPTVADYMTKTSKEERSGLVYRAFKIHVEKTHQEIMNLCESGVSTNYFLFENFITHMKSHPEFKNSSAALKALLKLSVFSNILLNQSIQGMKSASRGQVGQSFSIFEHEIFKRLSADWTAPKWEAFKLKRKQIEKSSHLQVSLKN